MKRFIVMAVFAFVFITTSAKAADKGIYMSGDFGLSILSDAYNAYPVPAFNFESSYDMGFNVGFALGYNFGSFRAEGELAYHSNDVDALSQSGLEVQADGIASVISFMANGYYDFHSANSPLVPYLGGGIGYANFKKDYSVLGTPFIDDTHSAVFAYQFMVGLGFNINLTTTLTASYRYFVIPDSEFNDLSGTSPTDFDSEYQSHEFDLGVRVAF